jgi:uncharacterized protein YlaI
MSKECDKCRKADANVSYTQSINGKTQKMHLCSECANSIIGKKEEFLNSFFNLDPFKEIDEMFNSMPMPRLIIKKTRQTPPPQPQIDRKEDRLRELKDEVEALKQEEGIAVMLQDYMKAAEIKTKREKLQKEAEKIINN